LHNSVLFEAAPVELTAHRRSLKALTGIRILAALYVVIYHSRLSSMFLEHGHALPARFFGKGYFAVPVFFILSGFILAYTYEGQIEDRGDHRRFWEARFARIWPAYALSLVVFSVVDQTIPNLGTSLATLLMVQAWNPFNLAMAGAGNFVCWSLSTEAFFYLVFPWFQTSVERRSPRTLALLLVLMLAMCVALNSGRRILGYTPTGIFKWIPFPLIHLSEFLAGVCMGNLFLFQLGTRPTESTKLLPGSGTWTYVSVVLSIVLLATPENRWSTLAVLPLCSLIYGLAAERTRLSALLSTQIMLLAGGISYSVYLFQLSVKEFTLKVADRLGSGSPVLRMAGVVPLLLLLSYIIFRFVEEPARRWIRGFFAAREQGRLRLPAAGV
jgi:peptidoglycan/LPS O-acetylase OafA/YrhL